MNTRAGIPSQPVHPALIVLPRVLLVFSLFCDVMYLGGAEAGLWPRLALYSMVAGFIGAFAAVALPGFADLAALTNRQVKKVGVTHMNLTLIVVALYALNMWLRFSDPANMGVAIALSVIGVGVLAASIRLGRRE